MLIAGNKESGQGDLQEVGYRLTAKDSHSRPRGALGEVLDLET